MNFSKIASRVSHRSSATRCFRTPVHKNYEAYELQFRRVIALDHLHSAHQVLWNSTEDCGFGEPISGCPNRMTFWTKVCIFGQQLPKLSTCKHRFQWNLLCSKGGYPTFSIPNFSWLLQATPKQSWNLFERVEPSKIGHLSITKLQLLVDFMRKFRRAHLFYVSKQCNKYNWMFWWCFGDLQLHS